MMGSCISSGEVQPCFPTSEPAIDRSLLLLPKPKARKQAKVRSSSPRLLLMRLNAFKVLLLGSGDSGKTTVLKQMRVIHRISFTPEEIERFKTDGEFFWRFRRTLENEMNVSTVRSYISLSLSLFGS